MRNKKLMIALAFAVVFGLIAALSISRVLSNANASSPTDSVVVARVDIPIGTKIIPEQLTTAQLPLGTAPEGTFKKPEDMMDRVSLANIYTREPITESKLAPPGSAAGLSSMIAEGYRAMTVKVDEVVGVSGFLTPGALVDVLTVIDPPGQNATQNPISKVVLQNIKVLASGQNIDQVKNDREANTVRSVTLQVTPDQAEKLALASIEGKLQLMMRNGIDQLDEPTRGVNKQTLLTGERATLVPEPGVKSTQPQAPRVRYAPSPPRFTPRVERPAPVVVAAPVAPPRRVVSVEVIEGSKKKTVEFP